MRANRAAEPARAGTRRTHERQDPLSRLFAGGSTGGLGGMGGGDLTIEDPEELTIFDDVGGMEQDEHGEVDGDARRRRGVRT